MLGRLSLVLLAAFLAGCHSEGAPAVSAPASTSSSPLASSAPPKTDLAAELYAFDLSTLDGKPTSLAAYKGKTMLIVNTASECGYTPQYQGLEGLYETYKDRGLVVLGFPCNDFGGQEPGDAHQIKVFCEKNFGVTFPLFEKLHTIGPEKAPLYKLLTERSAFPGDVKWNFTKFLVSPKGEILARFESKIEPNSPEMNGAIEKALPH